jgi:hypothetical protein
MHYVASVSGGAGSTVAAHRCVELHPEHTTLVFADTNSEHPSLYESIRYMRDVALPHIEFVWINDGRNIWDVFNQYGYMKFGGTGCKASLELKKNPLDGFFHARWRKGTAIAVTGLDYTEQDRIGRFDKQMNANGYATWHPLSEPPLMNSCQQVEQVNAWGYPEQTMYKHGYPHNNCGGACVLAGISQWVGLKSDFPEKFEEAKQEELKFFERTGYCILRDRRGGTTKPMLLADLEKRIENNDLAGLSEFRSTCSCMTPSEDNDETIQEVSVPLGSRERFLF